jgi:hypothetical protein
MINSTTASYLVKSFASDRRIEAARERRLTPVKQSGLPDTRRMRPVTRVSRLVSVQLHRPFRPAAATR